MEDTTTIAAESFLTEQTAIEAILSAAGVTRVSLGAQSFNQKKLRVLDRSHTETDIVNAVNLLRKYHLHVSIDLIFGAPDETFDVWKTDLEKAIQTLIESSDSCV